MIMNLNVASGVQMCILDHNLMSSLTTTYSGSNFDVLRQRFSSLPEGARWGKLSSQAHPGGFVGLKSGHLTLKYLEYEEVPGAAANSDPSI